MSTDTIIPDVAAPMTDEVAAIISGVRGCNSEEHWVLEPGDAFYEEPAAFEAIDGSGTEYTNFIRAFGPDGQEVKPNWDSVKPKLSRGDLQRFRVTPNAVVLGTDGTVFVSAGIYGRRETSDGTFEYLPDDEWQEWRNEQTRREPRTLENQPFWSNRTDVLYGQNVEYVADANSELASVEYKQRLSSDGSLGEPWGRIDGVFRTADELRDIARQAVKLADQMEHVFAPSAATN